MIVDPDFLNHWKTRQLIAKLGDSAPLAIIALWCHCQSRKTDTFDFSTPRKLAGICGWSGDAEEFLDAVTDCGFLDPLEGESYQVHGWRERNKQITRMWKNDQAAKPIGNLIETNRKPIGNVLETNREPIVSNLILSNPISSEDRESEGKEKAKRKSKARGTAEDLEEFCLSIDLPPGQGQLLFDKWEGSGWVNGKTPIKDWRATARNWKSRGWLPLSTANGSSQNSKEAELHAHRDPKLF